MKKVIIACCALSLMVFSYEKVFANDGEEVETICFYTTDENGDLVYVCEEVPVVQPNDICSPECWDV